MRAALPALTFASLDALLTKRSRVRIGYATEAMCTPGGVGVLHHESFIARIGADSIRLYSQGYASRTTGERLDAVLTDNGIGFRVGVRGGVLRLLYADTLRPLSILPALHAATFRRDAEGTWILADAS